MSCSATPRSRARRPAAAGPPVAEDLRTDEPHSRGDPMAVRLEVSERLVGSGPDIHPDALDERLELRARQVDTGRTNGWSARPCGVWGRLSRAPGPPFEDAGDLRAPAVERRFRLHRIGLEVDAVVDRPTHVEHRRDSPPPVGRQHQERVVEARLAGHGRRRQVTRRQARGSASARGNRQHRARNTSKPPASIRSRTRTPASQVARSSQPRRPVTPSATGRPASKSPRVRATTSTSARRHFGRHRAAIGSRSSAPASRTTASGT